MERAFVAKQFNYIKMKLKQFIARIYDADNKVISNPHFFAKDYKSAHISIREFRMKHLKLFSTFGGKPTRYILSQTDFTNHQAEIISKLIYTIKTIHPL